MSSSPQVGQTVTLPSPKQQLLDSYAREHETTMRVLRAYPTDKLELRPHAKCKNARELAWMFAMERAFATMVVSGQFGQQAPMEPPLPPESWDELLVNVEQAYQGFMAMLSGADDAWFLETVPFLAGKDKPIRVPRLGFLQIMLADEIHHRGQFSIYLRMADGRVPSIYGPTADEPWM